MWREARASPEDAWRALYDAADSFRALAPWKWIRESDLFAVRHPESGEFAICCVLGFSGDLRGLSVSFRLVGGNGDARLLPYEFDPEDALDSIENSLLHDGLSLVFSDGHASDANDERLESNLGLPPRAVGEPRPRFRGHRPACEPWYLTIDEVAFMDTVLEQTLGLAARARRAPDILTAPAERVMFARTYDLTLQGLAWRDAWISQPRGRRNSYFDLELDTVRLDGLRSLPSAVEDHAAGKASAGTWEVDFVISPAAIRDGPTTRPIHPYLLLVVDQTSGMVLKRDVAEHAERHVALRELVLETMEAEGRRPESIWVRREGLADCLFTLAECLDIALELVPSLIALDARRLRLAEKRDGRKVAELGVER